MPWCRASSPRSAPTGELTIDDDGQQRRDFTFIDDAVDMIVQMVGAARPLPAC